MGNRKKRGSTAEGNGQSKRTRKSVNASSEPASDNSDIDTGSEKKNVGTIGGYDDNDESYEAESGESQTELDSDSDDEVLSKVARTSKTSTSRKRTRPPKKPAKSSNKKPPITDKMIKEKELEVKAIVAHERVGTSSYKYRFQWKDKAKGETWVSRIAGLMYYPNLIRDYDVKRNKADEVEAVLAYKESFNQPKFLLKWKDTARGESWVSRGKANSLCLDMVRKFVADEKKANEIETILSRKKSHGDIRYLVKWKDQSKGETWESVRTIYRFAPGMVGQFLEQQKKAESDKPKEEVESIVSDRKANGKRSYLVKWKDDSMGESWVTENRLLNLCPKLLSDYKEEIKRTFLKANEVEAILDHKRDHGNSKYLIKWKDHSKGETWETAITTMKIAQDVLDKFVDENPDCAPVTRVRVYGPRKGRKKKKNRSRQPKEIVDRWEDSDTDLESQYINVKNAMKDVVEMSDDDNESEESDRRGTKSKTSRRSKKKPGRKSK